MEPGTTKRKITLSILGIIVAVAAYFRLWRLGEAALRGDTIHFLTVCGNPELHPGRIVSDWLKLGITGHFPFPLALTRVVTEAFSLPVTEFSVRLPSALLGICAVPVMFLAGRRLAGDRFGLVLAALLAVNPFHLQISREAYFYSPVILGASLLFLAAVIAADYLGKKDALPLSFHASVAAGLFLTAYSQISAWPVCILYIALILGFQAWRLQRKVGSVKDLVVSAGTLFVLGFPLTVVKWGLPYHLERMRGSAYQAHVTAAFGEGQQSILASVPKIAGGCAWGTTFLRMMLLLLVIVSAAGVVICRWKRKRSYVLIPVLLVGGYILIWFAKTSKASAGVLSLRYLSSILPVYLAFLGLGLWYCTEFRWMQKLVSSSKRGYVVGLLAGAVFLACLIPDFSVVRLSGKPAPYKEIQAWVNSELPKGTLVLVDRWFEPWNELKVYSSTNARFTFTFPNEPLETFKQVRWRDSAKHFFTQYPQSAYLEIAKSYWDEPNVGPWDWPRRFFARQVTFVNTAGLKLRKWGLADRGDFYVANTNRLVVELFYNTREDLRAKAKASGLDVLVLYGAGWGYTKPFLALNGLEGQRYGALWNEIRKRGLRNPYMDWRLLEDKAALILCNLTDKPLLANLEVAGMTLNGTKKVNSGGSVAKIFEPGKRIVWEMGPIQLPPGQTVLTLKDDLWALGGVPLLVDKVSLDPSG